MPKFVIEREIPGAGKLSQAELKSISKKSCGVLSSLGPSISWIESYVTADKLYCVTTPPMNRWCGGTRSSAAFRPTRSRRSRASSILQPPSRSFTTNHDHWGR